MNEETETLAWSVRPSEERPGRMPIIFAVALAAVALGTFGLRQPVLGVLGGVMVLAATADFWMGSRFALDSKGATARTGPSVTAMEWGEVKRILIRGREVRLSPLEHASRLEEFRGVGLVTTQENHEAVLRFVRSHAPEGVS